jgi:hypothetical protein
MCLGRHVKDPYSCQILIKREFSRQIYEKYSEIKFNENPFRGSRVTCERTDGQADMMKLLGAFAILRTRLIKTAVCSIHVCTLMLNPRFFYQLKRQVS